MNFFRRKPAAKGTNGQAAGNSPAPAPVDKQFALVEESASAKQFVVTPVATAPADNASTVSASADSASASKASINNAPATSAPAANVAMSSTPVTSAPVTTAPVTSAPVDAATARYSPPPTTNGHTNAPEPTHSVTPPPASRLAPSLIDAAVRLVDGNHDSEPVISVRGLKKIYQMGDVEVAALQGVDIDIYPGEVTAIMGPSGSGKSTLMNIIGCLDVPSDGTYFLDGTDVSKLNDDELAAIRCKKIGFVFQSFNLLSRTTALANVELPLIYAGVGGSERHKRAKSSLTLVGLEQRMDHKPNELSGGQQQRVAIARALINEPAMILADEPTGNLDSKTSVEIMELFQRLNVEQGITIVFVTHNAETADYCHRTIRVRDGLVEVDRRHRPIAGIYSDPAIQARVAAIPDPYAPKTSSAPAAASQQTSVGAKS